MCNKYGKIVLLSAVIAVFGLAANVQAEVVYDFDDLTTGALLGQDGWYKWRFEGEAFQVATGASGWSGNYAYTNSSANSYARRDNDTNWSYSLTDGLDFDVSADFLVFRSGDCFIQAGIVGDAASPPQSPDLEINAILVAVDRKKDDLWWGIHLDNLGSSPWVGGGSQRLDISDNFPGTEDFIITLGWAVTATGPGSYSAQPYYDDGSRVNVGSARSFTSAQAAGDISTLFDGLFMRGEGSGLIVDNIRIDQVPEPSTMTLLACGLFGLLAYAWRKRKCAPR